MTLQAQIKWVTNIADFKKAIEEGTGGVVAHTAKVDQLTRSLSGNGLLGAANNYTAAIEKMGGIEKLTAAEKEKINGILEKALVKYQALGQTAPAAIQQLAAATRTLEPPLTLADRAAGLLKSTFGQFTLANLATSAIQKLVSGLGDFIAVGLKLPAVEQSFNRLTKSLQIDGATMLANMAAATKGMVANYDLMLSANKAMLLGLPVTAESMGELAKTATILGKAMGQDATKSLDDLITALGRSSPMILDNLGLTVKVGEANEAYAAKLGKTAEQLTDAEKKLAFYDAAMEAARRKTAELGDQTKTLGEIATTVWTQVGNVVSSTAGSLNTSLGSAIGSVKGFAEWLLLSAKYGSGAALTMIDMREQITQLDRAQKAAAKDVNLGLPKTLADLNKEADALRTKALAPLSAETRALIVNFDKGGLSAEKIAEKLKTVSTTANVNEEQISRVIAAQKKAVTAGDEHAKALEAIRKAAIPLTAAQMAQAEANEKLGVSAETTAKTLGIGAEAVTKYLESLKNGKEIEEIWRKFHQGIAESSHKFIEKWISGTTEAGRKVADASGKAMAEQLSAATEYQEKNYQLTLRGSELTIRQAELERDAKIRALTKTFDVQGPLYASAKREIEAYYQHQIDLASGTESTIVERMRAAGVATRADLQLTAQNARRDYEQMAAHSGEFSKQAIEHQKKVAEAAERAAAGSVSAWSLMKDALGQVLKSIPQTLADAFTGGGGIMGAVKSIATQLGAAAGGAIGFAVGGPLGESIGKAIGSLAGPLVGLFQKMFGTAGRDAVLEFTAKFGSFDALHEKLLTLGAAGEALWVKLTQGVGRNNPEQAKKVIEEINAALAGQDAWMQRLPGLIEKYGLSWEQAGLQAKQAHLDEIARGLIQDFADLSRAGFDVTLITEKMTTAVNDYVSQAIRTGTEIPAAMRPLLQKMIDMGALTDDAGVAITDLGNLKFAETLTEGFKTVVDAIRELTRALTGDLGGALDALSRNKVVIPIGFQVDPTGAGDPAVFHSGTARVLPFITAHNGLLPDEVPAILQTGEAVLNRRAAAAVGTQTIGALNRGDRPPARNDERYDRMHAELVALRAEAAADRERFLAVLPKMMKAAAQQGRAA